MNRFKKKIITSVLLATFIFQPVIFNQPNNSIVVEAHSGRTDGSGGHHDNKNKSGLGSYHYHCGGNPAHLHTGGVCPYNSNTATTTSGMGTSSGSLSTSSSSQTSSSGSSNKIELSNGDTTALGNDLVKIIQDVLNQKGYDCGTPDGIAGTKTKNAIEQFVEDNKDSGDTDFLIISMAAEALGID